jgi:AraC-like DNA-binding protein
MPRPRTIAWDGPYCPYIVAAGDHARPPWTIRHRRLPFYLLVASLDGEEDITVGGRAYHIPSGGGYLIPPTVLADIGSRVGNRPVWVHCDVLFHPRRGGGGAAAATVDGRPVPQIQPGPVAVWGTGVPVPVPTELAPRFARDMQGIVTDWQSGQRLRQLRANHRLAGLLLELVAAAWDEATAPAADPGIPARLRSAEEIARASLAEGFSVDDFARAAGWSRSRFAAVYQELRGESPGAFLRRERLTAAAALLTRGGPGVEAVARAVGYADATVFGRAFRGQFGMTPGRWRERQP